jgi:trigger factor
MATIETLENSYVKVTIEVSADQFDHGLEYAFSKVQPEVEMKGFRKGKVPRSMYERKFGVESLYEEAINHVISETYFEALQTHEIYAVAQPKIDLDITLVAQGKPFTYSATVAVKPDVKLGDYKNLEMKKVSDKVTSKDITQEIDRLREQNAELQLVENRPLKDGDTAIFDFEGKKDGVAFDGGTAKNYELKIGSNQFIPGFEAQMIGLKTGDTKDLDVTFPKDYQAADLAGQAVVFTVTLHEIKEFVLPALDDTWVKSLKKEGVTTVDELKASVKKDLESKKETEVKNAKVDFVVSKAAENATLDIPQDMIVSEKNRMLDNTKQQASQYGISFEQYLQFSNVTQDQFEANLMKDAEKSIRYNLVLEAIAKAENIEVPADKMESKMNELAVQYNLSKEQIEAQISEDVIKQDIAMNMAVDLMVDSLVFKS